MMWAGGKGVGCTVWRLCDCYIWTARRVKAYAIQVSDGAGGATHVAIENARRAATILHRLSPSPVRLRAPYSCPWRCVADTPRGAPAAPRSWHGVDEPFHPAP